MESHAKCVRVGMSVINCPAFNTLPLVGGDCFPGIKRYIEVNPAMNRTYLNPTLIVVLTDQLGYT